MHNIQRNVAIVVENMDICAKALTKFVVYCIIKISSLWLNILEEGFICIVEIVGNK